MKPFLDGFTHEVIVLAATCRLGHRYNDDLAIRLANYQTHYQLALDLNQPSETRIEHHEQAMHWGARTASYFHEERNKFDDHCLTCYSVA